MFWKPQVVSRLGLMRLLLLILMMRPLLNRIRRPLRSITQVVVNLLVKWLLIQRRIHVKAVAAKALSILMVIGIV